MYYNLLKQFSLCIAQKTVPLQDFPIETVYKTAMTFQWAHYDFNVTFSYFLLLLQLETHQNFKTPERL